MRREFRCFGPFTQWFLLGYQQAFQPSRGSLDINPGSSILGICPGYEILKWLSPIAPSTVPIQRHKGHCFTCSLPFPVLGLEEVLYGNHLQELLYEFSHRFPSTDSLLFSLFLFSGQCLLVVCIYPQWCSLICANPFRSELSFMRYFQDTRVFLGEYS